MIAMRNITVFLFASMVLWGCNLEEINENPNVPLDAPLNTLLPPSQKGIADAQGGRIFRYTGIFGNQLTGVEGRELAIQNYSPEELFVGNPWSDLYAGSLLNLRIIIDRASESSPHYAGIARILMAQGIGMCTDIWGDVPYSQALQGSEFPHPVYDPQQDVYTAIFALLDRAVSDLDQETSAFSPGADDLMYGGDLNRWKAAAAALRARYALRTLKRNPNAPVEALEALNAMRFQSPEDDLAYPYLGQGDDTNPIGGFYESTPLAIVSTSFLEMLSERDDPRTTFMTNSIPFSGGNRRPGDYFSAPAAPVRLVSYVEQEFIRAEALLRTGDTPAAEDALQEVVRTSMDEVSDGEITTEEAEGYLAAHVQLDGSESDNLRVVMTQKYIAMFTTIEPWTDFRRTGFPELTPIPNGPTSANPNGQIPRRLIYPQSERLRNNNFPQPVPNMQTRFWWDME